MQYDKNVLKPKCAIRNKSPVDKLNYVDNCFKGLIDNTPGQNMLESLPKSSGLKAVSKQVLNECLGVALREYSIYVIP